MTKQLFDLAEKVKLNAQFFRLLALIILATIIISKLPWINGLLGRVINIPDVRHNVSFSSIDSESSLIEADVINLGQVKADNVLLHFQSRNGKIYNYFIESEEVYEIQHEDNENGQINILLERLAPGAEVHIELVGQFVQDQTNFSATSDQGSSVSMDLPSFLSQVQSYSTSVTSLYDKTATLIKNNIPFDEQKAVQWGNSKIIGFPDLILLIKSDDFKTAVSATIALSLLIGLFLPHLAWLIPIIAMLVILLLADFQISFGFLVAVTLVLYLPARLTEIDTSKDYNEPEFWYGPIALIIVVLFSILAWDKSISARWLAIPVAALVAYLLALISIIIPNEETLQKRSDGTEHRHVIQSEQTTKNITSLDNLNDKIGQITEYLSHVEQQLEDQRISIFQLTQRYDAVMRFIRIASQNESHTE